MKITIPSHIVLAGMGTLAVMLIIAGVSWVMNLILVPELGETKLRYSVGTVLLVLLTLLLWVWMGRVLVRYCLLGKNRQPWQARYTIEEFSPTFKYYAHGDVLCTAGVITSGSIIVSRVPQFTQKFNILEFVGYSMFMYGIPRAFLARSVKKAGSGRARRAADYLLAIMGAGLLVAIITGPPLTQENWVVVDAVLNPGRRLHGQTVVANNYREFPDQLEAAREVQSRILRFASGCSEEVMASELSMDLFSEIVGTRIEADGLPMSNIASEIRNYHMLHPPAWRPNPARYTVLEVPAAGNE